MTNYADDERERQEYRERFEHAINCMDISPISMMAFERVAREQSIPLSALLQEWLLTALELELSKDAQLELPFGKERKLIH